MKRSDWQRDMINRQRNIVFPDTALNEGRMFRSLFSFERRTPAQRIGILLVTIPMVCGGALALAFSIACLVSGKSAPDSLYMSVYGGIVGVGMWRLESRLCVRGFFPASSRLRKGRSRVLSM